jgi:hypothetical protein
LHSLDSEQIQLQLRQSNNSNDTSTKENMLTANFGGVLKVSGIDLNRSFVSYPAKRESPTMRSSGFASTQKTIETHKTDAGNTQNKTGYNYVNMNRSLVNDTLNLMTRNFCVQNSAKSQRKTRHSHNIRDGTSLKKKFNELMFEIKNGVRVVKDSKFDILENTSVHFSDFRDYEGENDPSNLKKIIRDLEIENREKDAEIIKLGMQVKDLSRLITNYIRCQKYGVAGKINFDTWSAKTASNISR